MPKVTEAHRESRRDQILDAAVACFAERGFQATSMADVFERSGLSAGAVYSYFGGKQELAVAAAKRVMKGQIARLLTAADCDPVPSPAVLMRLLADGLREAGVPTSIVVQLWGEAVVDPEFHAVAAAAFGDFARAFRRVLARWAEARGADAEAAATWAAEVQPVIVAVAQGYMLQSAIATDFDVDAYFRGVERVFGGPVLRLGTEDGTSPRG